MSPDLVIYVGFGFQVISSLGVLVSVYVSLRNHAKIDQLTVNVDGRLGTLLDNTKAMASAEGQLQGRSEITLENAAAAALLKETESS